VKTFLIALLLVACGSRDQPEVKRDTERPKRVIEPPSGKVRPLPPHAIRADGVGPFALGASLQELVAQLPSPRIETFDVPNVGVHSSILRAEDDAIVIGGEPMGKARFIAVVGADIARTESGLHVGSTRYELVRALGAPVDRADRARDPHIIVPSGLRNARVVLDGDDKVAAIVVIAEERAADAASDGCARPPGDDKRFGACMTPAGELVERDGDDLTFYRTDSDKPVGHASVPGLVFVQPLRTSDGRDEVVAISRSEDAQQRTWSLAAYGLEGGKLVKTIDQKSVYTLTAASARWIGAELRDLDLYLELASHPDSIEVGGLLTRKKGDRLRDIVVISPVPVARHR
jgi:hypothetical protein